MGGKVPLNGNLDFYATAPKEALQYSKKGNLVGFGFAPEGIENNEVIYELLTDWGWRNDIIDLDQWLEMYCKARYGGYPPKMKEAWHLLQQSCFGTFTDHPRFKYQFRPGSGNTTVHKSKEFNEAVQLFLACSDELGNSELYVYDAIELGVQVLGLRTDALLEKAEHIKSKKRFEIYEEAIELMMLMDKLLASHPNHKLENWVDLARNFGDTPEEKQYYESNAKRLITTWGGNVNEYSARTWNGLIGTYYAPRWQAWLDAEKTNTEFDIKKWEEEWIQSIYKNNNQHFDHPVNELLKLINN